MLMGGVGIILVPQCPWGELRLTEAKGPVPQGHQVGYISIFLPGTRGQAPVASGAPTQAGGWQLGEGRETWVGKLGKQFLAWLCFQLPIRAPVALFASACICPLTSNTKRLSAPPGAEGWWALALAGRQV